MSSTEYFQSTTIQTQSKFSKSVTSSSLIESDKGITLSQETRTPVKGAMPGTSHNSEKHHVESSSITLTKDGNLVQEKRSAFESQEFGKGKGPGGLQNAVAIDKVVHSESSSKTATSADKASFMAQVKEFQATSTQSIDDKNSVITSKKGSTTSSNERESTTVVQSIDNKGNKHVSISTQENMANGAVKYSKIESTQDSKGQVSERKTQGLSTSAELPNGDLKVSAREHFDEIRTSNSAQAKATFDSTFNGASAMTEKSYAHPVASLAKAAASAEMER